MPKIGRIPEKEYNKIISNVPICCVDLVIAYKGKVLLVYRNGPFFKNKWFVPGGRIYKNETIEEAVKRKAFEETGLKVKIIKQLGVYQAFEENEDSKEINGFHTIGIGFLVEPVSLSEIKLDETSSAFKWISLIEDDLHEYNKRILKDSSVFD